MVSDDLVADLLLGDSDSSYINRVVQHESLPSREEFQLSERIWIGQLDLCQLEKRHEVEDVEPETLLDCLKLLNVLRVLIKDKLASIHLLGFLLDLHELLETRLLVLCFDLFVVHFREFSIVVIEEVDHPLQKLLCELVA